MYSTRECTLVRVRVRVRVRNRVRVRVRVRVRGRPLGYSRLRDDIDLTQSPGHPIRVRVRVRVRVRNRVRVRVRVRDCVGLGMVLGSARVHLEQLEDGEHDVVDVAEARGLAPLGVVHAARPARGEGEAWGWGQRVGSRSGLRIGGACGPTS